MQLYELNQAGYASLPKMSKVKIEDAKKKILDQVIEESLAVDGKNLYFMFLNNESHYYTIFAWINGTCSSLVDEIFSIVKDLGILKSIEKNDNGAWEFWITGHDATTRVYYLFNYTEGVIEV